MNKYILHREKEIRKSDFDQISKIIEILESNGKLLDIPLDYNHRQNTPCIIFFIKFFTWILRVSYSCNKFEINGMYSNSLKEFDQNYEKEGEYQTFYFRKFTDYLSIEGIEYFFKRLNYLFEIKKSDTNAETIKN